MKDKLYQKLLLQPDGLFCRSLSSLVPNPGDTTSRLLQRGLTASNIEYSFRFQDGTIRSDRIMLEQVRPRVLLALYNEFDFPHLNEVYRALQVARKFRLPIIGGWDGGTSPPAIKLYINASNVSAKVRKALLEDFTSGENPANGLLPHILGWNFFHDGRVEQKLYFQSDSNPQL